MTSIKAIGPHIYRVTLDDGFTTLVEGYRMTLSEIETQAVRDRQQLRFKVARARRAGKRDA
jgi:hypothetical protein